MTTEEFFAKVDVFTKELAAKGVVLSVLKTESIYHNEARFSIKVKVEKQTEDENKKVT